MQRRRWSQARSFRAPVLVVRESVSEPFTPFAVQINFGELLQERGASGRFDRHLVMVRRLEADGRETVVAHASSGDFAYGDRAEVCWVIEGREQVQCYACFGIRANGASGPPEQVALVANADGLRYNGRVGEPLDVGIPEQLPVFVERDGAGLADPVQKPLGKDDVHVCLNTGRRDETGLPMLAGSLLHPTFHV